MNKLMNIAEKLKEAEGIFIPNCYEKKDFEKFLKRELDDKEFEEFKLRLVETKINDEISSLIRETLQDECDCDFEDNQN